MLTMKKLLLISTFSIVLFVTVLIFRVDIVNQAEKITDSLANYSNESDAEQKERDQLDKALPLPAKLKKDVIANFSFIEKQKYSNLNDEQKDEMVHLIGQTKALQKDIDHYKAELDSLSQQNLDLTEKTEKANQLFEQLLKDNGLTQEDFEKQYADLLNI